MNYRARDDVSFARFFYLETFSKNQKLYDLKCY